MDTKAIFTFLASCQNLNVLMIVDKDEDALFVPKAICGGKPTEKYAGKVIKPPPPK